MELRFQPFAEHGGRVSAARDLFGGTNWLDLSTGIAPWAYPVDAASWALKSLPEPGRLAELEQVARAAFSVPVHREVVAVPGTDIALRLLARLIPSRSAARLEPCYPGHQAAWPDARPLGERDADLIVIANPNNPDGRCFSPAALQQLGAGRALVVDEAYAEATPGVSVAGASWERLIVLRSFGKFFGLPGLRLGFVIAEADVAAELRSLLGDWPISAAALVAGTAAYADYSWQEEQRRRILAAGAQLDAALADGGLKVFGATPFFRLIERSGAEQLFEQLARAQILTRPFHRYPDRLRIGLPPDAAAVQRLTAALRGARQ